MRRARALGVGIGLLGGGLALAWATSTPAPRFEPWTDPLPQTAVERGYARFYGTWAGRAWPALDDAWLGHHPPSPAGPVLVDRHHASKQPEDQRLGLTETNYAKMHGLARAFDPAREAGVEVAQVRVPWTPLSLGGASAVFLNLVSGDHPRFRASEVSALLTFVRRGGGLLLLTDHSNCYFHAEVLQPLTVPLGLGLPPVTAADRGAGRTLSPRSNAWVQVGVDRSHPVTAGVRRLGFMTAGAVEPVDGSRMEVLVRTSEQGWADRWEPHRRDDSSGFTGNLQQDAAEPTGSVGLVAAGEYGAGRVVVLADQNAWGSTLIGIEDNARLFTNALAWVSGKELPYEARGPRSVTTFGSTAWLDCATAAPSGFRTLQVLLQRVSDRRGVAEHCTARGSTRSEALLVLPDADRPDLIDRVRAARRVVGIVEPGAPGAEALLGALGWTAGAAGEPGAALTWGGPASRLPHPILEEPGRDDGPVTPVTVTGAGRPWATDDLGRPVALHTMLGATELVLVLDDALLRNERLGAERDAPAPGTPQATAHRLALRLFDWLVGG